MNSKKHLLYARRPWRCTLLWGGEVLPQAGRDHCSEGVVAEVKRWWDIAPQSAPASGSSVERFGGTCFSVPLDQRFLLPFSVLCCLSSVPSQDPGRADCSEGQNKLLSAIKAWRVPPEGASLPLVQSAKDLKEILCTAAAFLQGLWGAGTYASAQSPAALSQDHFPCPYPGFSSQANWPVGFFGLFLWKRVWAEPPSLSLDIPYS